MALTWRFLVLTAIAAVPIALRPEGTTFLVMLGVLAIIGLLDWLSAPGIRALGFQRTPGPRIRLGEETHAVLTITNSGRRSRRLLVRDAWAPTAGAQDNRFRAKVRSGSSHERTTVLRPTRRGMLRADRITVPVALKTKLLLVVTSPVIVNDIHGVLKAHARPART